MWPNMEQNNKKILFGKISYIFYKIYYRIDFFLACTNSKLESIIEKLSHFSTIYGYYFIPTSSFGLIVVNCDFFTA